MGGYYLTALAAILGPVRSVAAFTATNDPDRVNTRIGAPGFGQAYDAGAERHLGDDAVRKRRSGHAARMNSDCIEDEETCLKIYGTEGILTMGDPNQFGAPVTCRSRCVSRWNSRSRTGIRKNSRGLGAAEMAWSILAGRDHRASKEMAYHVFETMHGIMTSAETGSFCQLHPRSRPRRPPRRLPQRGRLVPKGESALI